MKCVFDIATCLVDHRFVKRHGCLPGRKKFVDDGHQLKAPISMQLPQKNEFDLSMCMYNLPNEVFIIFVMAHLNDDFWRKNLENNDTNYFDHFENHKQSLLYINELFAENWQDTYQVICGDYILPWNDLIVPLYYKFNKQYTAPMIIDKPKLLLWTYVDRNDLTKLLTMVWNGESPVEYMDKLNDEQRFYSTACVAPALNGTACSGKTTILNNTIKRINEFDPKATILKVGRMGSYAGKDVCQFVALTQQITISLATMAFYTSIVDRDAFNNALWRLIQFNWASTNVVEDFVVALSAMDPQTVHQLSLMPVIYIIDTDVIENRRRMHKRNMGGDSWRCRVEQYVARQNMAFAAMAYLFKAPLFDRAHGTIEAVSKEISNLLYKKSLNNYHKAGKVTPTPPIFTSHGTSSEAVFNDIDDYQFARNLTLYK